jgi:hypothetical protein
VQLNTPSAPADTPSRPNAPEQVSARLAAGLIDRRGVTAMLLGRLALFALFQALVALILMLAGGRDPWRASAAWWPITATLTNLLTIAAMAGLARREGLRLGDLYGGDRRHIGRDLLALIGVLVLAAPLAALPNIGLATLLFGDPQRALDLFVQPLPGWAAILGLVLFPVTTALAELPAYHGYVRPRLEAMGGGRQRALILAASCHALQHVTLPLLMDWRFIVWRGGMFLPFAFLVGAAIRWRPSLLPYLMVIHGLIDVSAAWMVVAAST